MLLDQTRDGLIWFATYPIFGSTVSPFELIWILIGIYAVRCIVTARQTSLTDQDALMADENYLADGPRAAIIRTDISVVNGLGILVIVIEVIGFIEAMTPPPAVIGPSVVILPPLVILVQLTVAFICNTLVSGRKTWRAAHLKYGPPARR